MILMTDKIIRTVLFAVVLIGSVVLLRKNGSKKHLAAMGLLVVVFAFVANLLAGILPPLTDEVTLTALGECRSEAEAAEVYLKSYTVDGTDYDCLNHLEIDSGHWFWSGECYCWRPETDTRQPDGMTRTVVVGIPVGWSRTLNFASNIWKGKVQIETGGDSWVIDTYGEEELVINEPIGGSEKSVLIWNQIRYLAVYTAVLLALASIAILIINHVSKEPEESAAWLGRNKGRLVYAGIAVTTFAMLVYYANSQSLWNDDLQEIGTTMYGLKKVFSDLLTMRDASPPFFGICACLWYSIAPYGERWLLLLPITAVALFIYVMGLIGERLNGKPGGVFLSVLVAFSITVWGNAAFEFRPYGFVLLLVALCLYFHIRRNQANDPKKWMVLYSISMTCLAMTHYFGMLACGLLFFADVFLCTRKQLSWKAVWSYIPPAVASTIWLALIYMATLRYRSVATVGNWYPVPSISAVRDILYFLAGRLDLTYWVFLLGGVSAVVYVVRGREVKTIPWNRFYQVMSAAMIAVTILIMYVYGNYVNRESTMWIARYFFILLPPGAILSEQAIFNLIDVSTREQSARSHAKLCASAFFAVFLSFNCMIGAPTAGTVQPFRQAADWIYSQGNYIFNDDTVVYTTSGWEDAYNEYYISRQGRRDPLNVIDRFASEEELLQYNRVYFQYGHTAGIGDIEQVLNEYYTLEKTRDDIKVKVYVRK